MNIQRLLGTNTVVNPELLKLASSPFPSLQQRQHQNMCAQNCEENHLCDPQIQNQIPQDLAQEALPFNHTQFVESNMNIIPYPSIFQDSSFQQHSQPSDLHCNGIDHTSYVPQLPNYDYPPISELSTYNNSYNNNQNFSYTSVLSTPSSSPTPLNSNSTYVNGCSSTEDETESYVSSNNFLVGFGLSQIRILCQIKIEKRKIGSIVARGQRERKEGGRQDLWFERFRQRVQDAGEVAGDKRRST
ncbi:hypothetical protein JHK86_019190 [Glycine max]|nr:hypothetical protein JHK86_019190 [Glycine max]